MAESSGPVWSPPTAGCPGPCPGGFWRSPRRGFHNDTGLHYQHSKEMLLQRVYLSILEEKLILLTETAFCSDFMLSLVCTLHQTIIAAAVNFVQNSVSHVFEMHHQSKSESKPCILTRSTEQPIWTCKQRARHKAVATRWSLCIIFKFKFRYGTWRS